MKKKPWPPIWIGTEAFHTIGNKDLKVTALQEALNKHLSLKDYGAGIQELRFIAVVMPKDDTLHPDDTRYASRLHRLSLWRKLDYEQAIETSEEGFLQMVALAFLKTISEISSLGITRFNSDAFYKDAAQALKEEGYLQHSVA